MKKTKFFTWITAFLIILAFGCGDRSVFEESYSVDGKWSRFDTAIFKVKITDTLHPFEFFLNIRNSNDYKFRNIFFFLHTTFPSGHTTHDTIECILADKAGKWLGKGIGSIKENDIILKDNLLFPEAGTYRFSIEQAMRKNDLLDGEYLIGIEDIGIRIKKCQE